MTLSKLSLAVLATLGLFVVSGCPSSDKESGDTDDTEDTDDTNDTIETGETEETGGDTDDYFEPYYSGYSWVIGVQDGEVVPFLAKGSENPSYMVVDLYEKAWADSGDDRYACEILYTVEGGPGVSADGAYLDFVLTLTEVDSSCDNLNPDEYGENPGDAWLGAWEVASVPLDPAFASDLEDSFTKWGEDWANDWEPYVVGAEIYIEGKSFAPEGEQWFFTRAFEVDGDMNVLEDMIPVEDLEMGADGVYMFSSTYVFYSKG